jgi:sulfur carrier protein
MTITINGDRVTLPQPATVAQLLEQRGLARKPCAVEVNQTLVPKDQHAEKRLAEGDIVEIVTLVGGG